jgi:hypothetical protein
MPTFGVIRNEPLASGVRAVVSIGSRGRTR